MNTLDIIRSLPDHKRFCDLGSLSVEKEITFYKIGEYIDKLGRKYKTITNEKINFTRYELIE